MKQERTAISVKRADDFNKWYQEVIKAGNLAEASSVRGCMIIKPNGYGIWENLQRKMDDEIKERGVQNAYFPLLIPLSAIQKEAEHVEGFAKECAVVTHKRLESQDGVLKPTGELEEPYVIRPTSEMVIGESFSKWINSHRDLPMKLNQWANVMRWEMRPRVFLRTSEFLWQEGHTAHATEKEAMDMSYEMVEMYRDFSENVLGMAVTVGEKTPSERFPGAQATYTIEALMQDGKALQAGTSHFLGQNFSKAQNIKFLNKENKEQHAWTTSWGVSTRLIGGMIMSHGDDDGMIIPPRVAPHHIKFIPIFKNDEDRAEIESFINNIKSELKSQRIFDEKIKIDIDWRDIRGGDKYWETVKAGTPIIVEVGKRDIAKGQLAVTRRDIGVRNKEFVQTAQFIESVVPTLEGIQNELLHRSRSRYNESIVEVNTLEELKSYLKSNDKDLKLAIAHVCDCDDVVKLLKEHKSTLRCIPMDELGKSADCIVTGQKTNGRVLIGQSY